MLTNPMNDKIKHIVVLMLENRSLDSVLGWLYETGSPQHFVPASNRAPYDGLNNITLANYTNELKKADGTVVTSSPPVRGASALDVPNPSPHEEYEHINVQLFGQKEAPAHGTVATMKGVLQDYASKWNESDWEGSKEEIKKIMQTFTPDQLPMLNGLAGFYAVSDAWFASVPTQTNANRAFSMCGTSMGLVDNGFLAESELGRKLADDRFKTDTIWNVLDQNGKSDWKIFWESVFPPVISSVPFTRRVLPHLEKIANIDSHFARMEAFHDMARKGTLPAFSYLEPAWTLLVDGFGWKGDDYHPPGNTQLGENLVRAVYQSLTANPKTWAETLLVITFDEHVGSFDHVSPPWTAKAPWGEGAAPYKLQYEFDFRRFGPRVPAILVSPWIEKGTVFRSSTEVPYDHTSLIATVLGWFGVPKEKWNLGARVAAAPTFGEVLTRDTPRTDLLIDHRPVRGQILSSGDLIHLEAQDGRLVVALENAIYPYPCLDNTGAVSLRIQSAEPGAGGLIREDSLITIRTTETMAGQNTELGAWADRTECYYYAPGTQPDKQTWRIKRVERGGDGYIRCGDKVYLLNQTYEKQHLNTHGLYLTTSTEAQSWGLEPVPDVIRKGALKSGDRVNLMHVGSGNYCIGLQRGSADPQYPFPRLGNTGKITLELRGDKATIESGDTISLVTTEARAGVDNILGAWADRKECYYYKSHTPDKQRWIIRRADGKPGAIQYGDTCFLINVSYTGQRLVPTDVFLTTEGGDPNVPWLFELVPSKPPSDVVRYGEDFYLRHVPTGRRFSKAHSGFSYYFPRLSEADAVLMRAEGAPDEIKNMDVITLVTTETNLGDKTVLGAWADSKQCYYYRANTDKSKQSWQISRKATGGDGKVRYGEEVYLTNVAYTDQRLIQDSGDKDYVTTAKNATETWVIERR